MANAGAPVGPTQGGNNLGPPLIAVNPAWQPKLIVASCIVGALLLIVGLGTEITATLDGILSTVLIVSGLALVFAAFGAQATVQYKGWVLAGVAAIALIFLFAIDYLRRDTYVIVDLMTPKAPTTKIRAGGLPPQSGAVDFVGDLLRTRFVVHYDQVRTSGTDFRFIMEWPRENPQDNPHVSICFARDKLIHWFGRGRQLSWYLRNTDQVYDSKQNVVASRKECGESASGSIGFRLFSLAHAQTSPQVDSLIQDLLSDNTDVRRIARDRLSVIGPSVIRPVMDRAIQMTKLNHRLTFRMQVGAAVIIDKMLATGGETISRSTVQEQLTSDDFDAIIQWTLNRDQSLLGPSLRILANTADLNALRSLMTAIEKQTNENIGYNTAWVLRQSSQRFRNDQPTLSAIKQLAKTLRPRFPGEKTTNFLNQIEAM